MTGKLPTVGEIQGFVREKSYQGKHFIVNFTFGAKPMFCSIEAAS